MAEDINVNFQETTPVSPSVFSVNGQTGNVTITLTGLGGKSEQEILYMIAEAIKGKLDDDKAVHKDGNETIDGKKTFKDDLSVLGTLKTKKGIHTDGKYLYASHDEFDVIGAKKGSLFIRKDEVQVKEINGDKVLVLKEGGKNA